MRNKLISFILALTLLMAAPLSAIYKYNPYTRKLDYYERVQDSDLADLGDVTFAGVVNGDIIIRQAGAWQNLGIGAGGQFLSVVGGLPAWAAVPAGVTTFIALTDTPGAYAGAALQLLRVNAATNAVEFAAYVALPNTIGNVLTDHNLLAHTALGLFDASADVDHNLTTNYLAAQHLTLPSTIAAVLTDHNKAAHDALLIDADTVDGEHAAAIVTNARVKAHFPDTIVNILSDHNLLAHTALGLFDASADVDHNLTTNYAANQHVALPNTIANVLSDHNLAAHTALGIPHPANVFYVSATGGDYTTIQAALNAQNAGGETFLVGPGTYVDTIVFTANDQVVKPIGHAANVIVTQADATVVDARIFTDCIVEGIEIRLTAPTTAINAIQVGTGSLILIECRGYLATAIALVQADQPALVGFTEPGTIRIKRGNYQYYHTGATGAGGIKAAFRANWNLAELHLHKVDVIIITNSGTAAATTLFVTTGTAMTEMHNCVDVAVTDPNATLVVGLGYVGGAGAHNVQGNYVDVVATANTGYGLYHGGTATVRSGYNAIHVADTGGTSYAFFVGASATLNSHFDDLRSDDGNSIAGTFVQVSSPTDGDLAITDELEVDGDATFNADIILVDPIGADTTLTLDWAGDNYPRLINSTSVTANVNFSMSMILTGNLSMGNNRQITIDNINYLWDNNGTGDDLLVYFLAGLAATDTAAIFYADVNPNNMTDHDNYLSPTFVLANNEGADVGDYAGVVIGERTQADVKVAHYFDFFAMTGATDGSVVSADELGATFRFGDSGSAIPDDATGPGDVLFEDDVEVDGNQWNDGYNRFATVFWIDCFDHGTVASKYQFDWDITSLNTQGAGTNTVDTTPSEITLTTDNNAIADNEGTRTEFTVIQRARQNRTEWSLDLKQTANTQFYMGWNTSGTNAMVAAADEYVIVFFDVSDNANWQIKVGDGATEDVFTSAVAGAVAHITHEIWVETDGTVHWAVNGTEIDITGTVDNLMVADDHYLIVGQAQSVTGAAAIVVEIDYVENEKTKAH